ncbi:uncharacterized protein LOC134234964 [Saccostrea cucullata]|uniref:uncharacterized protein LOC134234964 n=1 Tax=Saccostrea cuccullata TaxID=36930 RepID=UPI002ED57712
MLRILILVVLVVFTQHCEVVHGRGGHEGRGGGGKGRGAENRGRGHMRNQPIAFTARMSENATNIQPNDTIPYTMNVVNSGNGYQCNVFTAPKNGFYFFTWSVTSKFPVVTALVKNNDTIAVLSCHNFSNPGKRNTCSQSTTIQLTAGDQVSVRATETMDIVSASYWPSFSGFRL